MAVLISFNEIDYPSWRLRWIGESPKAVPGGQERTKNLQKPFLAAKNARGVSQSHPWRPRSSLGRSIPVLGGGLCSLARGSEESSVPVRLHPVRTANQSLEGGPRPVSHSRLENRLPLTGRRFATVPTAPTTTRAGRRPQQP